MPSTKDGKPFLHPDGRPVVLHSEEEENSFRADHPEAADRIEPVKPPAATLEAAKAEIEELKSENSSLRSQIDALRSASAADVDTDMPDAQPEPEPPAPAPANPAASPGRKGK